MKTSPSNCSKKREKNEDVPFSRFSIAEAYQKVEMAESYQQMERNWQYFDWFNQRKTALFKYSL